jgi:hypothetical protein
MKDVNDLLFTWLAIDSSIEEYTDEISSIIERENNEWLLLKIDTELREHMEVLKELLNSDPNEAEYLNAKIEMISLKLGILKRFLDDYRDNQTLADELEEEPGDVKVLFAKNPAGNVMALKQFEDIKDYGDDKYETLIGLLKRLMSGDTDFNQEKQRQLRSSDKLKGIYELKDFQIRLIYMREGEYTIVIGALVKKDDNALRYRSSLENMRKQSERYRRAIQDGKLDMDEELKRSSEIIESLTSGLKKG